MHWTYHKRAPIIPGRMRKWRNGHEGTARFGWFSRRRWLRCAPNLLWQARAQEAGKAEVRILVGFPAGGTVDAIARVVADKLKNAAGGPVSLDIENKPGAAGLVATKALLASPPDGTYCCWLA